MFLQGTPNQYNDLGLHMCLMDLKGGTCSASWAPWPKQATMPVCLCSAFCSELGRLVPTLCIRQENWCLCSACWRRVKSYGEPAHLAFSGSPAPGKTSGLCLQPCSALILSLLWVFPSLPFKHLVPGVGASHLSL